MGKPPPPTFNKIRIMSEQLGHFYFIGKCWRKGCATIHRMEIPKVYSSREVGWPRRQVKVLAPAYWPNGFQVHCREHKQELRWRMIKATISESHICNAKCTGATGPNCECSCGGKNHGGKISLI